ncbi:MAG: hypothetical protein IPK13_09625 [Deltaproteobacteria bacterium]|nr:hypothetical protein [Deltaproteobacteria bacterium]
MTSVSGSRPIVGLETVLTEGDQQKVVAKSNECVANFESVGRKFGTKIESRIRAGGVVLSKLRLLKEVDRDPSTTIVSSRKLRIVGLPNRKGGHPRHA